MDKVYRIAGPQQHSTSAAVAERFKTKHGWSRVQDTCRQPVGLPEDRLLAIKYCFPTEGRARHLKNPSEAIGPNGMTMSTAV